MMPKEPTTLAIKSVAEVLLCYFETARRLKKRSLLKVNEHFFRQGRCQKSQQDKATTFGIER